VATGFGHWRLDEVTLQPAGKQGEIASLHIHASNVCVSSLGKITMILITLNFIGQ
jgi:hypothetical protein